MSAPLPFPWSSLEAVPRASVTSFRDARRWATRHVRLDAFARALGDMLGDEVRVRVRRATARAAGTALFEGVGLLFARTGGADDARGTGLLEVEGALAAAVVARAIRRPAPSLVEATSRARPPSGALAGAVAAIVVAASRRARADTPLRVLSAGPAETLESEFLRADREVLALSLTVLVGDDAFEARLVVERDDAWAEAPFEWTLRGLAALGATPLALPLVATATRATLAEVAELREGDAWIPGAWPLDGLRGSVLLAAPTAVTGVRARLVENDRLVLSGEVDAVCPGEEGESTMGGVTESDGRGALLEAVGDVPVVVRVEIGEARMPAREWASLGRGDVVTLGRRVGDLVILRVGGIPVARGELVNVDGEVGVRIAERFAGDLSDAATEQG